MKKVEFGSAQHGDGPAQAVKKQARSQLYICLANGVIFYVFAFMLVTYFLSMFNFESLSFFERYGLCLGLGPQLQLCLGLGLGPSGCGFA